MQTFPKLPWGCLIGAGGPDDPASGDGNVNPNCVPMRWILLMLLTLASVAASAQPLMTSTRFASVDFDKDGINEADYEASVSVSQQGNDQQFRVFTHVVARWGVFALRETLESLYFGEGSEISTKAPVNGSPPLSTSARLVLYISDWDNVNEWQYYDVFPEDNPGDRLTVYVGLRFPAEGGLCHGWLKFVRPSTELPTLFTLDSYDWNPIPGAPIRAGLPPEIPIQSEWLPDGETLRFTWPPVLTSWILESTPSLVPPVVWEPAEYGGGYADVLTTGPGRFFRLRRP